MNAPPALLMVAALAVSSVLTDVLQFGNPALLVASLATLAVLCPACWPLLGVGLALKPQLAVGAAVYLYLVPETRASARKALLLAVILFAVGFGAAAHAAGGVHFWSEIAANVHNSALPGHSTDASALNEEAYSFLNLQPLLLRILPVNASWASLLASGLAVAVLGVVVMTRDQKKPRPYTALAILTLLSMLPVYHREYDRVAVLLLIPAVRELGRLRWVYAVGVILWLGSDLALHHVMRRFELFPWTPLFTFVLTMLLLLSFAVAERDTRPLAS